MIKIQENYKEYIPHSKISKSVERLVSDLPQKWIAGLGTIILTNTNALNNKRKRQNTKYRTREVSLNKCAGWYMKKWDNQPAYIELLVDNIFLDFPKWLYFSNFFVDYTLGYTIFHEIGHHIHKTQSPEFKEKEDVANKWRDKLTKSYFPKKYWYIIYPVRPIFYVLNKFKNKT